MHIVEEDVPEFERKWGTGGFFGEDAIDTLHQDYSSMIISSAYDWTLQGTYLPCLQELMVDTEGESHETD